MKPIVCIDMHDRNEHIGVVTNDLNKNIVKSGSDLTFLKEREKIRRDQIF